MDEARGIELCNALACTGCGACVNICPELAINMIRSEEGFDYPVINRDLCISCGLCMDVCPILSPNKLDRKIFPETYAAWSLDPGIRSKSSSGGVFTALAEHVIENLNGVVFGASYSDQMEVKHRLAESISDLDSIRGSKYVQSDIGLTYRTVKQYLENGKDILFSGTPCQIAGLYGCLQKEYPNLFTIDLVCHGVPSPGLFEKYIQKLKKVYNQKQLKKFSFRYLEGWCVRTSFLKSNKTKVLTGPGNIYIKAYLRNFIHRESCYICPYSIVPRQGDITLGDFWGIGKEFPFKHDVKKGISLVLSNSLKGANLLIECKSRLYLENRRHAEALNGNRSLKYASFRPDERDSFYLEFNQMSLEKLAAKYDLKEEKFFLIKRIYHRILRMLK